ncbi:MAG: hypothetical protein AAFV46_00140 [Cyanobacteria bacterium J06635_11]
MTTIAWSQISKQIAADRIINIEVLGQFESTSKLYNLCDAWFGFAGDSVTIEKIVEKLRAIAQWDKARIARTLKTDDGDVAVIAVRNKEAWYGDSDGVFCKIRNYCFAIGSGAQYAIGAMAAGAGAREAVEIASDYDPATGQYVDAISLD